MTTIKQEQLVQRIADAFQFISFYHPVDFIQAMAKAYEAGQSPAAKTANRWARIGKIPVKVA